MVSSGNGFVSATPEVLRSKLRIVNGAGAEMMFGVCMSVLKLNVEGVAVSRVLGTNSERAHGHE